MGDLRLNVIHFGQYEEVYQLAPTPYLVLDFMRRESDLLS